MKPGFKDIDPPKGSPEGYPKGFKGSSEDAREGFYTGFPEGPQDGFIGSPELSEECQCSLRASQPVFPQKGFGLWSPKRRSSRVTYVGSPDGSLRKSIFDPKEGSLASASLVTSSSNPQPSVEARCPVFERHHVTSAMCRVGPRTASECAPVNSVLQEQTCHVGCVELFEQKQSVSEPKRVDFDQFELESQREQSEYVGVVLH